MTNQLKPPPLEDFNQNHTAPLRDLARTAAERELPASLVALLGQLADHAATNPPLDQEITEGLEDATSESMLTSKEIERLAIAQPALLSVWISGNGPRQDQRASGFKRLWNDVLTESTQVRSIDKARQHFASILSDQAVAGELLDQGATELCMTVTDAENNHYLLYGTTTRSSREHPELGYDSPGAPGNVLSFCILLEDAGKQATIYEAIKTNPVLARQLIDMFMLKGAEYPQSEWADYKPPYDEWAKTKNGKSHMAFAKNDAPLSAAEVIEFNS
jgi:hypothetical protein